MNLKRLERIEKQLKKIGYSPYLQEAHGILFCGIDDKHGEPILGSVSQITIPNKVIKHMYFNGQIPVYSDFESIENLIAFIQEKYPIQEKD
ncbi:hypothetical protein [Tenacibaculum agarivorans]|uniref:hypothetical protein n=1 Tax=Tenacibaculum agarivorans TaxID=1908389 RepID=UPI00094B7B6F|nr:hypothetical protein [Tenacibaculum agarivorans]